MDRQITHPTKEQVRAYMTGRKSAHRPPPPPEEIRRQLGWCLESNQSAFPMMALCMLPSTCGQLTAQLVIDLLFAPARALTADRTP
ncbi:MAG: hypothetical protein H7335_10145 [Massilia sp.]|nr:hypothetical protein [Massilia sp.]